MCVIHRRTREKWLGLPQAPQGPRVVAWRVPKNTRLFCSNIYILTWIIYINNWESISQTKHTLRNWQRPYMKNGQHRSSEDSMAKSHVPGFGWTHHQNSSFEDSMARSHAPGFGWTHHLISSFEGSMARSPGPGFGWTNHQNSTFEDLMGRSHTPGFGWTLRQSSSFEESMARSQAPGFCWNSGQNSSFEDSMGRSLAPGFGWETPPKTQAVKSRWQGHSLEALVELFAKTQACKAAGQMM